MRLLLLIIGIVTWHVALICTEDNDAVRFSSNNEDNHDFGAQVLSPHRSARAPGNVTKNRRSRALEAVALTINNFSVNYFKILLESGRQQEPPNNVGWTPISTLLMLSMAAYGAGGNTAKELQTVFALSVDNNLAKIGFQILIHKLQLDRNVDLVLRSNIFVNNRVPLSQKFIDMALETFDTDVQPLDFTKPAMTVATIKESYRPYSDDSKREHARLADLNGTTRLVSANIVKLVSRWLTPFQPYNTTATFFGTDKGYNVTADTMYTKQPLQYGVLSALRAKFVGSPLTSNKETTMVYIILPDGNDGLPFVEKNINPLLVDELINRGEHAMVKLHLPRIRVDTEETIDGSLKKNMFTKSANFSGIVKNSSGPTGPVFTKIVQPVFIKINEEGIGFDPQPSHVTLPSTPWIISNSDNFEFKVNRPFLWIITSSSFRVLLFMGRCVDPYVQFF